MQCRAVPPEFVEVDDPNSPWRGRVGEIVDRTDTGTWWRDHLTGTQVFFPQTRS